MRPLILALLLVILPAAAAGQRTLHIESFDAEAVVLERGHTIVTERITARFQGQWNGIYRSIPTRYKTDHGLNYKLGIQVESVTDANGIPLEYEVEDQRGHRRIKMWVPGAHDATRTVVLRYRVPNMLRFFEQHDELYWNVTGTDWDVPIERASARVLLPARAAGLRATAYTGVHGARTNISRIAIAGNGVSINVDSLAFREGLTAVIGWDPGAIERPTVVDQAGSTVRSNIILVLPLIALLLMWRLWNRYGRDPHRLPISPAYEPPRDMTPAEAGTLIDAAPDMHDITATIVDLAVRGYLRIEERTDKELLGLVSSTGYTFVRTRDESEWTSLHEHEQLLLAALFNGRAEVTDDQLKNSFYRELGPIRESLMKRLIDRGYYTRRPDTVRVMWIVAAVASAAAVALLGIYVDNLAGVRTPAPVIAAGLTAVIIVGFGMVMPTRTIFGVRTLEKVLGFEEFLERVESDRYQRVIKTPEMFEKYLPYAMALKVESNWCRAFQGIYTTPPDWYAGSRHGHFSTMHFNSSISRMATSTAAVMASAPRSSSGSSGFSSGGGFSGGGFGGGGGGGF